MDIEKGSVTDVAMMKIYGRSSLHVQLIDALRSEIEQSRWVGQMPPESELYKEFGVSRMTLRRALARLSEDKWIRLGGRGRPHLILPVQRHVRENSGSIVRVLTPFGWGEMNSLNCQIYEATAEVLAKVGLRLQIEHRLDIFKDCGTAALKRLMNLPDTAGWILTYANDTIQSAFASARCPALVVGKVSPGVELPSVYADVVASSVVASRIFAAKGHKEAVYLISDITSITDRAAAAAFVESSLKLGMRARMVGYKPDCTSASRVITAMLMGKPRPTAFMVGDCKVAITLLCQMLSAGIKVPDHASIVCNWDDRALAYTQPVISRFRTNPAKMGKKLGEGIIHLIRHGYLAVRVESPVLPDFVRGQTIGLM